jgi:hypothetical protein
MEKIELDDPMYSSKHINRIGWSWYVLLFLQLVGVGMHLIWMIMDGTLNFWPIVFLIGAYAAAWKIGALLRANGYLTPIERKQALYEKAKDRKDTSWTP